MKKIGHEDWEKAENVDVWAKCHSFLTWHDKSHTVDALLNIATMSLGTAANSKG